MEPNPEWNRGLFKKMFLPLLDNLSLQIMNLLEKTFDELKLKDPNLDKYSFCYGMVFLSGVVETRNEDGEYEIYNEILEQAQNHINQFPRNN